MRDFYRIKEVYTRNLFCSVTGVLLEIRDPELVSNYVVSKPLKPNKGPKLVSLNVSDDEGEDAATDGEEKGAYLLRFTQCTTPNDF